MLIDARRQVCPRPVMMAEEALSKIKEGIVEVLVGLAVLTRWTVIGSYAAAGWLLLIAVNLVLAGFFDIAVRDVVLAVAAFTLARLTEAHDTAEGHVEERRDERVRQAA